jgi:hypothetical protein
MPASVRVEASVPGELRRHRTGERPCGGCVETSVCPKQNGRTKSCSVHAPRHAYAIVRFDGERKDRPAAAVQRWPHGVAALEPRCRKEQRQRIRRLERGGLCRGAPQQFADRIRKRLAVGSSKRCATSSKKPSGRRKASGQSMCARNLHGGLLVRLQQLHKSNECGERRDAFIRTTDGPWSTPWRVPRNVAPCMPCASMTSSALRHPRRISASSCARQLVTCRQSSLKRGFRPAPRSSRRTRSLFGIPRESLAHVRAPRCHLWISRLRSHF